MLSVHFPSRKCLTLIDEFKGYWKGADDCGFYGPVFGHPPFSGRQWALIANFDEPAAVSQRLFVKYRSHERIVEANKDQYYQALRSSQQKPGSLQDFTLTWAAFFLELLRQQKDDLKAKIDRERNAHRLPGLILKIERRAKDRGSVTVAFLTGELKANRNAIKKLLQRLVEFGRLVKQGKGRGTYYVPY